MIKTLLLDTFLLIGIIWMLISIVYFCVRMDRYLSPVEKHAVNDQAEEPEAAYLQFLKEDTQKRCVKQLECVHTLVMGR